MLVAESVTPLPSSQDFHPELIPSYVGTDQVGCLDQPIRSYVKPVTCDPQSSQMTMNNTPLSILCGQ